MILILPSELPNKLTVLVPRKHKRIVRTLANAQAATGAKVRLHDAMPIPIPPPPPMPGPLGNCSVGVGFAGAPPTPK